MSSLIDRIFKAAKEYTPTKEDIIEFAKRVKEREAEFAKQIKAMTPTRDWYNRQYGSNNHNI